MHQALYRKYRPRSFDDVYGQEHITSVLRYETQMNKISHAYLFCGPRGTGKTTCARILAKAINCENPVNGSPCGCCPSCISIDEDTTPDVLEMDAASNTGVDYIRDIRDSVSYTPTSLKYKVYIIDEVHMLSTSAFNAFLKTLEEPPEHAIFILATTEQHKLLPTIISRCQRFDFHRVAVNELVRRLMYIAESENIVLDETAATILAKQSMGGMRDAISLFELCSAGGHDVTAERVAETLGLTGIEIAGKTAIAIAKKNTTELFKIVKEVASSSKDISVFWDELEEFWRDMLIAKIIPDDASLSTYLDLTEPERRVVRFTAERFSKEMLTYHFTVLDDAKRDMTRSPQTKRITAELALIKMCDPVLDTSISALNARIGELEVKLASATLASANANAGTQSSDSPNQNQTPVSKVNVQSVKTVSHTQQPVSQPPAQTAMIKVQDIGDAVERLGQKEPLAKAFLSNAECYVSEDRSKVVIRVGDSMSLRVLSADNTKQTIHSSLVMSGICDASSKLTFEQGVVVKQRDLVDELD